MYEERRTFVGLALAGDVLVDEIDNFVDAWHDGDSQESLADFLGLSEDEYQLWVSVPDTIGLIVSARSEDRPLEQAINDNFDELKIAARAAETPKIAVLRSWLKELGKID